jgi:tRNA(Ile)-lysidine synthase
VSGGADSTALLAALVSLAPSLGLRLHAAHLHHGLRGGAADGDLEAVRALCDRLGVPLTAARWDCPARMRRLGLGGQAGLRILRRRFLIAAARRVGAGRIATAHTADDQLETVLMRLARGTGLAGIGGMSARRGPWIKPLLEASREAIEADLRSAGIPWREDASNRDRRYTRSRVRHDVIPALLGAMERNGGRPTRGRLALRVAALARELRAARRLTGRLAARIVGRGMRIGRSGARLELGSWRSTPAPVRRAVLRRLWKRLGPSPGLTVRHLDALDRLGATSRGGAALDLPAGFRAERDRGTLVVRRPRADTLTKSVVSRIP